MTLTPEQIALVKSSWQQVLPIQKAAAQLFYERLFELDPSLRPHFRGDMSEQGRKLMAMISTVVSGLDQLGPLIGPLLGATEELGRRHVGYGVTPAHYDTVGSALLWTLGKGLGEHFTAPVEAAWTEAYATLAAAMKQAAYAPS
jgi:hemoglobin-like flavoprotein